MNADYDFDMARYELSKLGANVQEFSLNGQTFIARVIGVYDGDTITVAMNALGGIYKFNVRLARIDTSEIKSKNERLKKVARKARDSLISMISHRPLDDIQAMQMNTRPVINKYFKDNVILVMLKCYEFDKYGRLLADVYPEPKKVGGADNDEYIGMASISDQLLQLRLAYKYGGDSKLSDDEKLSYFAEHVHLSM